MHQSPHPKVSLVSLFTLHVEVTSGGLGTSWHMYRTQMMGSRGLQNDRERNGFPVGQSPSTAGLTRVFHSGTSFCWCPVLFCVAGFRSITKFVSTHPWSPPSSRHSFPQGRCKCSVRSVSRTDPVPRLTESPSHFSLTRSSDSSSFIVPAPGSGDTKTPSLRTFASTCIQWWHSFVLLQIQIISSRFKECLRSNSHPNEST